MEGGLTTPTSSHRNWTSKGGHVSPDEVHHMVGGRNELRQYREMPADQSLTATFRNG